jgi:actin-related protein
MIENISTMRNKGEGGNSFLTDSQVWMDTEEGVKNSATKTFFGQMGGAKDIENIAKANRFKSELINQLKSPEIPRSFLSQEEWDKGGWIFWLPGHCHKEEEYDFFYLYKTHFSEKMKFYSDLMNKMKGFYSEEEDKIKERIKKQIQSEKEEREKKKLEKEKAKQEKEIEEQKIDKTETKEIQTTEKLMKICYEMFNDENISPKERTYRKIGRKVGLNHVTVKSYIQKYQHSKEVKQNEQKEEEDNRIGKEKEAILEEFEKI